MLIRRSISSSLPMPHKDQTQMVDSVVNINSSEYKQHQED